VKTALVLRAADNHAASQDNRIKFEALKWNRQDTENAKLGVGANWQGALTKTFRKCFACKFT
jgi:hypothetical protein